MSGIKLMQEASNEVEVSIITVTYNQKIYLERFINSILIQDCSKEIIIVDNCSQDGSVQLIKDKFPNIKVIENTENKGYGAGNNLGFIHAKGKYLIFVNPDTIMEDGSIQELITPLKSNKKVITTPKIILFNEDKINTCGLINHFTGLAFTRGLGDDLQAYSKVESINGFSGCCFAIKKEDFKELGGFDEKIFMYHDDVELSWRALLIGFNILYTPDSKIKHDYSLKITSEKLYHLEKGRYIVLRKYLRTKDFILLLPSLMVVECLTTVFALRLGWPAFKFKLKALIDGLSISVSKTNKDNRNLLILLSPTIPINQLSFKKLDNFFKKLANKIFEMNIKIINKH